MRILKLMLITFILVGLTIPAVGCGSESSEVQESQVVTVQRGSLTIEITAAGNLALSRMEDLAFEISGTEQEPLTVEEVLVEEGDTVEEGQVLVTLDTAALEEKVTSREQSVKTAEQSVRTAELSVKTAEIGLQTAQNDDSIRTAEIALEKAVDSYRKITYPYSYRTLSFDVPAAIEDIHRAELQLEKLRTGLETGWDSDDDGKGELWNLLTLMQQNLAEARQLLSLGQGADVFVNYGDNPVLAVGDYWTLRAAQLSVEQAQMSLDDAKQSFQTNLDKANISLENANIALEKANDTLAEARDDLEDAKEELGKATIVTPFTGFVTAVNVEGGDEVKKGTVAVQIADPDKFEAEIMVSEMDIPQVKLGGEATVQVDSIPGLTLPAKVTHISPTATIQSGVVNYKVKVEVEPGEAVAVPEDFQLREGLTVTVNIIAQQKTDVLLVPYAAITNEGGKSYVQVVSPTGATEKRAIKTGITDYQFTEVTEGLSEGEKVSVLQSAKTTAKTEQQPSGGMIPIPGVGGPPPGGPPR